MPARHESAVTTATPDVLTSQGSDVPEPAAEQRAAEELACRVWELAPPGQSADPHHFPRLASGTTRRRSQLLIIHHDFGAPVAWANHSHSVGDITNAPGYGYPQTRIHE